MPSSLELFGFCVFSFDTMPCLSLHETLTPQHNTKSPTAKIGCDFLTGTAEIQPTLSSPKRSVVTSSPIPPSATDNPDALLAKEVYDLLSRLDTAIPGLGRAIACLLTGIPIKGKSKRVGDCPRTGMR
jgi:hypothetical protein